MDNKNYKEWWILPDGQTVDFVPAFFEAIHVIEYSAYEQAQLDAGAAIGMCDQLAKVIEAERTHNQKLIEALEAINKSAHFYGESYCICVSIARKALAVDNEEQG